MESENMIVPEKAESDNGDRTVEPVAETSSMPAAAHTGPSSIHEEHLAQLLEALLAYDRDRGQAQSGEDNGRRVELLRASCLAAMLHSMVPDGGETSLAGDLETLKTLQTADIASPPEARVCRLWLSLHAQGPDAVPVAELEALTQQPLWGPVQAMAYRALAHCGQRRTLAAMLPAAGPLTLPQADAWLDAAHPEEVFPDWIDRITATDSLLQTPSVADGWLRLLRAETDLAAGRDLAQVEAALLALVRLTEGTPPRSYTEAEARIIAARAAAGRKRLYLVGWRGVEPEESVCADRWIPAWEHLYLDALTRWYHEDFEDAASLLQSSLALAPLQTPVRLAMASLQAVRAPDEAFDTLSVDEPTREILVARAAILARQGRYDEAQSAMSRMSTHPLPGREPLRYTWPQGRAQFLRQEHFLRAALAELRQDWTAARDALRTACSDDRRKTLRRARELWQAAKESMTIPDGQVLRRDMARQRLERDRRELGKRPLIGDARFFRAVATAATQSEQAIQDARTLMRQRSWVNGEIRAGSGRLVCVGDLLIRLGQTDEAIRVYEVASRGASSLAKERFAITLLYRAIHKVGPPQLLEAIAKQVGEPVPSSPWLPVLLALGFVLAGDVDSAMAQMDIAAKQGATDPICRLLRGLFRAVRGEPFLDEVDLSSLRLSPKAEALVRLLGTCGSASDQIQTFLQAFANDWVACCPFDPIRIVRRLAADPNSAQDSSRLAALTNDLLESSMPGAVELAALVRVVRALNTACGGRLDEAAEELHQIIEQMRP